MSKSRREIEQTAILLPKIKCKHAEEFDLVTEVHDLLQYEDRWCQGEYACNAHGRVVLPRSVTAARWCLAGAAKKVNASSASDILLARLLGFDDYRLMMEFNDKASHIEVVHLLKEAIRHLDNLIRSETK